MIWSKLRFQHSLELLPRVMLEVLPLLLPLSLVIWGMDYYVAYLNKARFEDPYNFSMANVAIIVLIGIIAQSFTAVISLLLIAASTQKHMKNGHGENPYRFTGKNFHQAFVEYIRSTISIGIYLVFFIIPGVFRWVQMTFVCLIAAFDPKYKKGDKDALKESSRLVGGAWFPLFIFLILQTYIPFQLQEWAKAANTPVALVVFYYLLTWVLNIYLGIYLALTFFARYSLKLEKV